MVSQRYRSQQTIGGKLLRLEKKTDDAQSSKNAPAENTVGEKSLSTNSVTSDALAPNSVDSDALGPGAVGTENLGVVDQINAGNKLALNSQNGVQLVGPAYTAPLAGSYSPLALDSSGNIVTNVGVTYTGTIDQYWTAGKPKVTLSDGTVVYASLGDQTSYNPGDSVFLANYAGNFTIIAHNYTRPQYLRQIDLTPYFQNGWTSYYSGGVGLNEFGTPSITMDSNGGVYLTGLIRRQAGVPTVGSVMFTLPPGFWPQERKIFISYSSTGIGQIEIDAAGNATYTVGGAGFMGLDNIRFNAQPLANWTPSTLLSGWVDHSPGSYATAGYLRDPNGILWTKGLIRSGSTTNTMPIQNLPNNVALNQHFATLSAQAFAYYRIGGGTGSGTGRVMNVVATTATWLSIEGFYVDVFSSLQWTAPLLTNSWAIFSADHAQPGYTKTPDGIVILRGLVKSGTGVIFTLPPGYRPDTSRLLAVASNGALGRVDILPNGGVQINTGSNVWFSLDQISFPAYQ